MMSSCQRLRPLADEARHQGDAVGIIGDDDLDAVLAQEFGVAGEILVLADHNAGDAELENRARAHHAGRQGGIERHATVGLLPAGLAQAIHLAVGDGVTLLYPLVAASRDEALALRQHAADGTAAFVEAGFGLVVGHAQKPGIHCAQHGHFEGPLQTTIRSAAAIPVIYHENDRGSAVVSTGGATAREHIVSCSGATIMEFSGHDRRNVSRLPAGLRAVRMRPAQAAGHRLFGDRQ